MESSDSETDAILAISSYLMFEEDDEAVEKEKRTWVRDIFKGRKDYGQYHTLYQELRNGEEKTFSGKIFFGIYLVSSYDRLNYNTFP